MKAKTKLYLMIYAAIGTLLAGCKNDIPYDLGQQEPMLIMNALLQTGEAENNVYLHLSENGYISHVKEATLTLYVNGQAVESPQAASPEGFKKFHLTTRFRPGDRIRLEATAEGGKYHVSSQVTVPHPVQSLKVDTATTLIRQWNGLVAHRQFRITLDDLPNERNFYRLEVVNHKRFHLRNWEKDTVVNYVYNDLINREDVILTDGHVTSSDDDENAMFPTIENKYNVFTDNRFTNASATLKVYTPLHDSNAEVIEESEYVAARLKQTITVRLLSLPETYYRYLKALNCMDDDDYDEALMEPISLPTNVDGGLGFVSIASEVKHTIELPEKEWRIR